MMGYGPRSVVVRPARAFAMPDFLRRMDVMIVPSRDEEIMRETFSQAMVQGMLTGLPVIASDLPVLSEKLDRGGGLTFRTVADLREMIARLVRDADLRRRLGAEARRTAAERYVWSTKTFVERYLAPGSPGGEAVFTPAGPIV